MHTEHLLGFKKTSTGKIIIDKGQAKNVKMIYRLFLEGLNNHHLQVYLENHNILTPLGSKKWTYAVINSILTNEKYCGDAILQKKFSIDIIIILQLYQNQHGNMFKNYIQLKIMTIYIH